MRLAEPVRLAEGQVAASGAVLARGLMASTAQLLLPLITID